MGAAAVDLVAVTLTRLGCKVGFIGKLRNDRFGKMLLEDFERKGVDVSRVIVVESARSASTFIAVDREGNGVIYSLGGKALVESPEELDLSYITRSKITYVGEAYPSVVIEPLSSARRMGIFIIYNLGVNFTLFGKEALKLAKISDLVVMSSRELSLLDINVERAARSILKEGPKAVIITTGREGSMLIEEHGTKVVPAYKARVVDTTGAGDAFTAGVIFGLLKGWDLLTCIKFGSAVAAIKVGSFGARCGLPTEREFTDFLSRHQGSG